MDLGSRRRGQTHEDDDAISAWVPADRVDVEIRLPVFFVVETSWISSATRWRSDRFEVNDRPNATRRARSYSDSRGWHRQSPHRQELWQPIHIAVAYLLVVPIRTRFVG